METVLLVVHLLIAIALVGVVLVQRSEGGALGIGGSGGSGGGGMMSARGAASLLTRTTAILAALFMISSLGLAVLANQSKEPASVLDAAPAAIEEVENTAPQVPDSQ